MVSVLVTDTTILSLVDIDDEMNDTMWTPNSTCIQEYTRMMIVDGKYDMNEFLFIFCLKIAQYI
jgi:hypothetical protein